MANENEMADDARSDIESGISAISELIPEMCEAEITRALEQMAASENVELGTCAQVVRAEIEAGRLPVQQFRAHAGL